MASQAALSEEAQATEGLLAYILRGRGAIAVSGNIQTSNVASNSVSFSIGEMGIVSMGIGASYGGRIETTSLPGISIRTVAVRDETLEKRFLEQADKWQRETGHLSSPSQKMSHPSYQAILGMAAENKDEMIRLLIRDLKENRRMWFWALSYLTQENPINREDAGKIDKMIDAWVSWAKARRLL
jgi:hypothetical protein